MLAQRPLGGAPTNSLGRHGAVRQCVISFVYLSLLCGIVWLSNPRFAPNSALSEFAGKFALYSTYICVWILLFTAERLSEKKPLIQVSVILLALAKAVVIPFYKTLGQENLVLPGIAGLSLLITALLVKIQTTGQNRQQRGEVQRGVTWLTWGLTFLIFADALEQTTMRVFNLTDFEGRFELAKTVFVDCVGYYFLASAFYRHLRRNHLITQICTLYAASEVTYLLWYWLLADRSKGLNPKMAFPFLLWFGFLKLFQTFIFSIYVWLPDKLAQKMPGHTRLVDLLSKVLPEENSAISPTSRPKSDDIATSNIGT